MPRILIVDDDEQMRSLIRERLADNYEIFDTGDPERAFVMTLQHKPDAILLDLSMPKLSGLELCQTISSLSFTRQIPIFIISGRDARNKAFCQNLGAVGYLEKPIDFQQLNSLLNAALTVKRPERRADVRVKLRMPVKLKGRDKAGQGFESNATMEDISAGGFQCSCTTVLEEGAFVEVFLCGGTGVYLGSPCLVQSEEAHILCHHFKFIEQGNARSEHSH